MLVCLVEVGARSITRKDNVQKGPPKSLFCIGHISSWRQSNISYVSKDSGPGLFTGYILADQVKGHLKPFCWSQTYYFDCTHWCWAKLDFILYEFLNTFFKTAGVIITFLHTLLFRWIASTQIRTLPLAFGTTTIPAHHSVGSLIFDMIPQSLHTL